MCEIISMVREITIGGFAVAAILFFGSFSLYLVIKRMTDLGKGFGVFNVRITGIVIVATLVSILAALNPNSQSAAIGILGAIAGYLFGYSGPDDKTK